MDDTDLALAPHPLFPGKLLARSTRLNDLDHEVNAVGREDFTDADQTANVRRIAFLKRRFLEDLREGTKIFVRRGRDSRPETVASFLTQFRRLSQAWVLLVVETEDERVRGTVVQHGHKFLIGYLGRLAITGDVLDSEVETWISVLLRAYGIVHGGKQNPAAPELCSNAPLSLPMLEHLQSCRTHRLVKPSCEDAILAVEIDRDMTFDETVYTVEFTDFPADTRAFVCSLWIVVPTDFSGTYVRFLTTTAARQMDRQADLRKRDVWQRIWTLGHTRLGLTRVRVELRTDAPKGTIFKLARPTIEDGTYPNPQEAPAIPLDGVAF